MNDGRSHSQPAPPPNPEVVTGTPRARLPGVLGRIVDRAAGTGRDAFEALDRQFEHHPSIRRPVAIARSGMRWLRPAGVIPEPPEVRSARSLRTQRPESGPHALVMSFRNWTTHVAYEYLVGQALQLHGARCTYVVCGGGLPICELGRARSEFPAPCLECRAAVTMMLEAGDFPYVTLDGLVDADERGELARSVHESDQLETFEVDGVRLAPHVLRSCLWVSRSGWAARTMHESREFREFVESAAITARAFSRLLDRDRPDTIVMVSGLFFAESVLAELATARGIRVVTYDFPGRPGTVFISDRLPATLYDISELWAERGNRPPTEAERTRVVTELAARRAGDDRLWQSFDTSVAPPAGERAGAMKLVAFTNVSWDTAVAFRDVGFQDMYEWLEFVIDFALANEHVQLDVRVHPGEVKVRGFESSERVGDFIAARFPILPPRIRIFASDDPVDSYSLLEEADTVLVYTSTIGLEAVLANKPTLVGADVHYRGKGFTHDIEGPEHLASLLSSGAELSLRPEQHDLAITYAYLFFFESMLELSSLSERWRGKPVFTVADVQDLLEDPGLERLCELALGTSA